VRGLGLELANRCENCTGLTRVARCNVAFLRAANRDGLFFEGFQEADQDLEPQVRFDLATKAVDGNREQALVGLREKLGCLLNQEQVTQNIIELRQ